MKTTAKVISAKSGISAKGNEWSNFSIVLPVDIHGAQSEVIATVWGITPEQAASMQSKVDEAKQSGQQVTVDVIDPKLESQNRSYEDADGNQKWTTNYTLTGGKVNNLRMEARVIGARADTSELEV